MPIPGQSFTILDPGLALSEPAPSTPIYLGTSSLGAVNTITSVNSPQAAVAALGQGPLSEAVCHALAVSGGPILCMPLNASVVGAYGAISVSRVGASTGDISTVPPAGNPFDAYEFSLTITQSGSVAGADFAFTYSLDGGRTQSQEVSVPVAGTFTVPNTNMTLTFTDGAGPDFFEAGDVHSFDTTAPYYGLADIASAVAVLNADPTEWAFMALVGKPSSAVAGAAVFTAMATHMTTFENNFRFVRVCMDAGDDTTANIITQYAAVSSNRVMAVYGDADVISNKPYSGWGAPKVSAVVPVAARATGSLISTDLGRVASGNLTGVLEISHDEFFDEVLDQHRIATLRTHLGRQGFYVTRGRLKSNPGSDFTDWQFGRIMDVACRETFIGQQSFLNIGVRTQPGTGFIDERDAQRLETQVTERLRQQLTQPINAEGTPGQVSALRYAIDRTNNIVASSTIISEVAIQPLGYARFITTTLGFALVSQAA